ncbi:MAG: hypothetical protein LKG27_06530 [Clostridiaceae bacterium]|jgi:hypothetical protein|nr:hypothetical protein [Clostridiaceae bacterium]
MSFKIKLLTILSIMFLAMQSSMATPFNANAKTKRIPAGTQFTLQMLNSVSTLTNTQGADFSAILLTDQKADKDVILPMGSLVRGSIKRIKPARRLSRGAILYLDFDHVVTPNGRQLPMSLTVVGRTDVSFDGGLVKNEYYKDALKENWGTTKSITKNSTKWGNDVAEDFAGGYFRILTVPICAIGGAIGGGAYYVGDGVADMVKKGKDFTLNKGDTLNVILLQPIDVPVL